MSEYEIYILIEGEPFLSNARKYRDEQEACHKAWRAFAQAKNAVAIAGGLSGLIFSGKAPDGWKKPNRKGWSRPVKGHPDEMVMDALPKEPRSYDVFGKVLCFDLNYRGPNGDRGFGHIGGFFFGPRMGWAGETFFAVIPDAKKAADDHLSKHPDHIITSGADKWVLPDGLIRISKAEADLIVAQYTVEREHAARKLSEQKLLHAS
jgi:hypothetical protein